ncbi:hypothetical protein ABZ702_34310, partial [Streptomyces cyaneofuscatus]|uniref:hypothetical protein n=1 Tax=Streptomyces cyaneofuscatus TaxID=66883 RepID=UPI0033E75884
MGEPDGEYTGVTEGTGDQLNVTVTSWGTWVGVVEVQLPAESRDNCPGGAGPGSAPARAWSGGHP